jgi:hypothetical protein
MYLKVALQIILASIFTFGYCQQSILINFIPLFNNMPIVNDSIYINAKKDTIQFETIKFYISNLQLMYDTKIVFTEKNSVHLIDNANRKSKSLIFIIPKNIKCNGIQFNLGIDSITNVSGALGGDLDPSKNMYWTWQSGYINYKIEGKCNRSSERLHQFQFHLGGYMGENNALLKTIFSIKNKTTIGINMNSFFDNINLQTTHQIMSPSKEAVKLSYKMANCFTVIE